MDDDDDPLYRGQTNKHQPPLGNRLRTLFYYINQITMKNVI